MLTLYTAVGILRFQDSIKEHKTPTVINNRQAVSYTHLDVYKRQQKNPLLLKKKNAGSLTLLQNVEYANRLVKTCLLYTSSVPPY